MKANRSSSSAVRLGLRTRGYADGLAGRPAARPEAEYQTAWRRGREARGDIERPVRPS